MSIRPILPHLSDQEILAISEACMNLRCEEGMSDFYPNGVPDPSWARYYFTMLLQDNDLDGLGARFSIDVKALTRRIKDWTEAELEGTKEMVVIAWQMVGDRHNHDLIFAAIRAKLTPTAHEYMQNTRRRKELHAARHLEETTDAP